MRNHRLPLVVLLGLWVYFAGALFIGPGHLYLIDTALIDVPFRIHAAELIRSGHFPFWTSMIECGFPLFSDGQTGIFYPFFLLYVLSPTAGANDLFVAVHYLFCGLTMYAFLAHHGLDRWASVLGAAAFMAGPTMHAAHVVPGFLSTLCWMPLALLLIDRYDRGHARARWYCALVNALIIFAGCPNSAMICFGIEFFYLAAIMWKHGWRPFVGTSLVAFAVPGLVAGIQLVPVYEYFRHSHRGDTTPWEAVYYNTVHWPLDIFTVGVSRAVDIPSAWHGFAAVATLGIVALVCRPLRTGAWLWFLVAAVGLAIACGTPLLRLMYYMPVAGWFRWPSLYVLGVNPAVCVLMAQGASIVMQFLRRRLPDARLAGLVCSGMAIGLCFAAIHGNAMGDCKSRGDFYRLGAPEILAAARTDDHFRLMPLLHGAIEGREPDFPQQFWTQQRMRDSALTLAPDYSLIHHVPVAILKNQVDAVTPRELTELITKADHLSLGFLRAAAVTHLADVEPLPEYLRQHTELISQGKVCFYRLKSALPRAWMVYNVERVDDVVQRLARIHSDEFDPGRTALVETEVEPISENGDTNRGLVERLAEPTPGRLLIDVDTPAKGLLVVADRYDAAVKVSIDGQPATLLRVNHAFRGVVVPPGKHVVEMWYVPLAFYQGLVLSGAGCLALVGGFYFTSSKRNATSMP